MTTTSNKTVAFDCQGTLFTGGKVLALYKWFESKGCQMIIWSSSYFYTEQAAEKFNLDGLCRSKVFRTDIEEVDFVDIAIDDNGWFREEEKIPLLATHHLIDVMEIPSDESKFEELFGGLL